MHPCALYGSILNLFHANPVFEMDGRVPNKVRYGICNLLYRVIV